MAKLMPANKFVVIEPTKAPTKGPIEAITKDKPTLGKVLAIGGGTKPIKMKVGDIIAYREYGQSKFLFDLKEAYFVGFADILGIVKEGK